MVANTFVPIISSEPVRLTVTGGGVTVLAGADTAQVSMTGLVQGAPQVLLRPQLGNGSPGAVRVVGAKEVPAFVIEPAIAHVAPGGTRPLSVRPMIPPPPGLTSAMFTVAPLGAGSISPVALNFPTDVLDAQLVDYTDANAVSVATANVQATGGPASSGGIVVAPVGKLVINELDYDQAGSDPAEFIEIYNRSADTVPLSGISVVMINGAAGGAQYASYDLELAASELMPGQYLVIRAATITLPPGTPFIDFPGIAGGDIQNGAPDGVAIVDIEAQSVIDALSYEGSLTAVPITGFDSPVNLVEGTATVVVDNNAAVGSLARFPNGIDTNNANTDFHFATTLTPGETNQ